jgi:hypothetical protein
MRAYRFKHFFQVFSDLRTGVTEAEIDLSADHEADMKAGGTFVVELTNTTKTTINLGNISTSVVALSLKAIDHEGKYRPVDIFVPAAAASKLFSSSRLVVSDASGFSSLAVQYTDGAFFGTTGNKITISVVAFGN